MLLNNLQAMKKFFRELYDFVFLSQKARLRKKALERRLNQRIGK